MDRVVPLAVELVGCELNASHLLVGDGDALWIASPVQFATDFQPGFSGGRRDEVDDGCVSQQRPARVAGAPMNPPMLVHDEGWKIIDELWGDDWIPVTVGGVSPESTAKYYAHLYRVYDTEKKKTLAEYIDHAKVIPQYYDAAKRFLKK